MGINFIQLISLRLDSSIMSAFFLAGVETGDYENIKGLCFFMKRK